MAVGARRAAPLPNPPATTVAPRPRRRPPTRRAVIWGDRAAHIVIFVGGLSVIAAVCGIMFYLVYVVRPLFAPAVLSTKSIYAIVPPGEASDVLMVGMDEYQDVGVVLKRSGEAITFAARNGAVLDRRFLTQPGAEVKAFERSETGDRFALGFADGGVREGRIEFSTKFLPRERRPAELLTMRVGETRAAEGGVVEKTPEGDLRVVRAAVSLEAPIRIAADSAEPVALDIQSEGDAERLVVARADGSVVAGAATHRENMITGEVTTETTTGRIPLPQDREAGTPPFQVLLAPSGDQLLVGWADGTLCRYDLADPAKPRLAESANLAPGARLTALHFMPGGQSLVTGDSLGRVRNWFLLRRDPSDPEMHLTLARAFESSDAPVRSIAVAPRGQTLLIGDSKGLLRLLQTTTQRQLAQVQLRSSAGIRLLRMAPKGDGVLAFSEDGTIEILAVGDPHPEVSMASLFRRVWYQGYPKPGFTWQSSSASDDFEPKLSLIPLIFGTLKATLFSMLIAGPIAFLGALHTSEFLDRKYRSRIKSLVEMMASIPSVVLGFLAALVLAPFVERRVLPVIAAIVMIPVAAAFCGYAWELLSVHARRRLGRRAQVPMLLAAVVAAIAAAPRAGALLERVLFAGDFKRWLEGGIGSGTPATAAIALPPIALALLLLDTLWLDPAVSRRLRYSPLRRRGMITLTKYAGLLAAAVGLAIAAGVIGTALGFDPRGAAVGTYVQRNALVVGFAMSFAVIPIIYTIAEDAFAAVPDSLRSASLGCGATRWQTALRVVLPVALPGVFSAVMVGLGRAIGETMIVLMAAGNTPILDINLFNGLRTLASNIAVELPEAARDGSLYRVLFLSALALFAMTFVVNTAAELVRLRFRKRTSNL